MSKRDDGVTLGADGYCHDCEDVRYCGTIRKCLHGKQGTPGVPVDAPALTDVEILDLAEDFRVVERPTSYDPYETFDYVGFARALLARALGVPEAPVVGPSGSDWELVGYFMDDGGRWVKMDDIYFDHPDVVPLYRKRTACVPATDQGADSMGKLISALEFVIRHSDSLTPSDIQRMQAILAEVTGDKQ